VDHLHVERSLIHADVKPKNICRFDTVHKMIDLDGAAREGEAQAGRKPSPAYTPPESARQLFLRDCGDFSGVVRDTAAIVAHPSFDSWSVGAVALELLSGFKLFPTDQADDRVIDRRSLLELVRQLAQSVSSDSCHHNLSDVTCVRNCQESHASMCHCR
jgi:serine/threonine protein kinase